MSKEFPCKECGIMVVWAKSKAGKKYLAQPKHWRGDDFGAERVYYPSHACTPNEEYKAAVAAERAWKDALDAKHQEAKDAGVVAPEGRQRGLKATVVRIVNKGYDEDFPEWKMTVQTDEGFRVWMSVPSALIDFRSPTRNFMHLVKVPTVKEGERIVFDATLIPSERDAAFAFGKRPVVKA